jgi:hypothetical protein
MNPLDLRCDESQLPADAEPGDPTPAEIRQACLRIQATWSEHERRYRTGAGRLLELEHTATGLGSPTCRV